MIKKKLHIICGNCGCNDSFQYIVDMEKHNCDNQSFPDIFIKCKHCDTLYNLADTMNKKYNNECAWDCIDEGMMGFTDYMWQTSCGANYDCKQIERPKYCPNCGKLVVNESKNK